MPRRSARLASKPRRDYAAMAGKKPRATPRPRVTKPLTRAIKTVLNRQLETKYVAEQVQLAGLTIPADITPNVDYHTMLPKVALQTAAAANNLREGDTIEPIKARISGHVWLAQSPSVAKVVYVKIYMVQPKTVKSQTLNAQLPDGLLDDGSNDPVVWTNSKQDLQAFYPVNKENYTVLKCFTFKLTNNGGTAIGQAAGSTVNIGSDRYSFTYSWKPPKLKYAEDADVYPTNHNPIFFPVIYSPGFNAGTDASIVNSVQMNWNIDMFYKDA